MFTNKSINKTINVAQTAHFFAYHFYKETKGSMYKIALSANSKKVAVLLFY